jgi:hypothetical protein
VFLDFYKEPLVLALFLEGIRMVSVPDKNGALGVVLGSGSSLGNWVRVWFWVLEPDPVLNLVPIPKLQTPFQFGFN